MMSKQWSVVQYLHGRQIDLSSTLNEKASRERMESRNICRGKGEGPFSGCRQRSRIRVYSEWNANPTPCTLPCLGAVFVRVQGTNPVP